MQFLFKVITITIKYNMTEQNEEYISVTSLNTNCKNENYIDEIDINNLEDNGICVYQIQSKINDKSAIIMKAGIMKEPHDVLIKELDILQFKYFIISKLYTLEQLEELSDIDRFTMIKIVICNEDKPIAQLFYNFNTIIHKQNNKLITEYLSEDKKIIDLHGSFSVTLHYNENDNPKYVELENLKTYCGQNEMMITLSKWLIDDKVKEILSKIKQIN